MTTNAITNPADYLDGYPVGGLAASEDSGSARGRYVYETHGPAALVRWYADALDLDPDAPQTVEAAAFLAGVDPVAVADAIDREFRRDRLRENMRAVARRLAGYAELRRVAAEYGMEVESDRLAEDEAEVEREQQDLIDEAAAAGFGPEDFE